jgi:anaphase-promoting complex subunit 6
MALENGINRSMARAKKSQPLSQIDKLRQWSYDALMQHQYQTAEFVAEKVFQFTGEADDAFQLAQVSYFNGNYSRTRKVLTSRPNLLESASCRYLLALSLTQIGEWEEALEVIGERNLYPLTQSGMGKSNDKNPTIQNSAVKLEASMCFLRGEIYTNHGDFDTAKECYKEAVQVDPKCFEAFDHLTRNNLLTPKEEWELLNGLDLESNLGENADLIRAFYTTRLSKYVNIDRYEKAKAKLSDEYNMSENTDVLQSQADLLFIQCKFEECVKVCEAIFQKDEFRMSALPNYLASLHELGHKNKLYLLAHKMADSHPNEPASWLAVGVYYLTINKVAEARRYFSKASMMHPYFCHAWIGFAHTFAVEGEHEQAIAAYSTATRLFQGTHLPNLFLGMQHLHLNNLNLAQEYLMSSFSVCPTDPLLLNEIGVVHYHKNDLALAEKYFVEALEAVADLDSDPKAWDSIQANLGHVYRRQEKFDKALDHFERVLPATHSNANILSAIGLVHLQAGHISLAIEKLNNALSITPNDPIATDLLHRALYENCSARPEIADFQLDDTDDELREIISDRIQSLNEEFHMEIESD